MSRSWAIRLSRTDAATLARLKGRHGLEVCLLEDTVWLRGTEIDDDLEKRLRALPADRFEVLPDRQLVRSGCRVPKGYLPDGTWLALSDTVRVELGVPALAAECNDRVRLQLVRGGPARDANLLLTTIEAWTAYGERAPHVRLQQLAFAASDTGTVLVRGAPLPPLPGLRFVEDQGIAVPCGWTWSPAVDAEVVRGLLQLQTGDLALLHADGTWDRLRADDFVRATRSAVRATFEGAAHE